MTHPSLPCFILFALLLSGCAAPQNETGGAGPDATGSPTPTSAGDATPTPTPSPSPTSSAEPTSSPTSSPTPPPESGETFTVEIGGRTQGSLADYAPSEITIQVGDAVVWDNLDGTAPHTATSRSSAPEAFDTDRIDPNEASAAIVFDTPGTYTYYCKYHSTMPEAKVIVEG